MQHVRSGPTPIGRWLLLISLIGLLLSSGLYVLIGVMTGQIRSTVNSTNKHVKELGVTVSTICGAGLTALFEKLEAICDKIQHALVTLTEHHMSILGNQGDNHAATMDALETTLEMGERVLDKLCNASLRTVTVMDNAINSYEAGLRNPPDPIAAPGDNGPCGGRILSSVNRAVAVFNKQTNERLLRESTDVFYDYPGLGSDPWIEYDSLSQKFFATTFTRTECALGTEILTGPDAGKYCTGGARFGLASFSVVAQVEAAEPLRACDPLVNDLTGKIAIIERGGCGFTVKAKNAQNAGAIAVIIYNSIPGGGPISMGGSDPTITIGVASVANATGPILLNYNGDVNLTLPSAEPPIVTTDFGFAVSADMCPSAHNDFMRSNHTFQDVWVDYEKLAISRDIVVMGSKNYVWSPSDNYPASGGGLQVFDKQNMTAGLPSHLYDYASTESHTPMPARPRLPLSRHDEPVFAVGFAGNTSGGYIDTMPRLVDAFKLFVVTAQGVSGPYTMSLPFALNLCESRTETCESAGRQEPDSRENGFGLENGPFWYDAVVYNNSMWVATRHSILMPGAPHVNGLPQAYNTIAWFEIDVSRLRVFGTASVKQFGTIDLGDNFDVYWPAIDVDPWGNVVVGFTISGPHLPLSMGATFRLASDPPGTMRGPVSIIKQGYLPFILFSTATGAPGRNRAGDYSSVRFDPECYRHGYPHTYCDAYVTNMVPMEDGLEIPPGVRVVDWSLGIVRVRIQDGGASEPFVGQQPSPFVTAANTNAATVNPVEMADHGLPKHCSKLGQCVDDADNDEDAEEAAEITHQPVFFLE